MFLLRAGMYAVVSVTAAVLPFAPEVSVSFNRSGFVVLVGFSKTEWRTPPRTGWPGLVLLNYHGAPRVLGAVRGACCVCCGVL